MSDSPAALVARILLLRVRVGRLTTERDALIPLAKLGLHHMEDGWGPLHVRLGILNADGSDTPATTAARKLLEGA